MDLIDIDEFCEIKSENRETSSDEEPPAKQKRTTRVWHMKETFDSEEDAEKYVSEQKTWKKCSTKKSPSGNVTIHFRCIYGKYRQNECPAGLYLLFPSTSRKVLLYVTECGHANHICEPTRGLTAEVRAFVSEKYNQGISKPNTLLQLIRNKNLEEPSKSQLANYLTSIRKVKNKSATVSASDMVNWCEAHSSVPHDENEPFVLAHHVLAESVIQEEQDLKIVLTTKHLLSLMKKSPLLQTDGTYKLMWQGYPVLLVGTSDKNGVFHPFALSITKGESEEDYAFLFRTLRDWNLEWKPTLLLADGADAITAAFVSVFGEPKVRCMCYFHVIQENEKFLKGLMKGDDYGQIKLDIEALQHCESEEVFIKASVLFVEKWKRHEDTQVRDFIDHFEILWLRKYPNWFEGAAAGYPSSNNGLEDLIGCIKKTHKLREHLPVNEFLTSASELVRKWSSQCNPSSPNAICFADTFSIPLELWTQAYHWALQNKMVLQRPHHSDKNCVYYFVESSTSKKSVTEELLSEREQLEAKWTTFDQFKKEHFSIWKIVINHSCVNESSCTCPAFQKKGECKHSLGMKIRLQLVQVPGEVKNVPLGQKQKRGRPAKSQKALLVQ